MAVSALQGILKGISQFGWFERLGIYAAKVRNVSRVGSQFLEPQACNFLTPAFSVYSAAHVLPIIVRRASFTRSPNTLTCTRRLV